MILLASLLKEEKEERGQSMPKKRKHKICARDNALRVERGDGGVDCQAEGYTLLAAFTINGRKGGGQ